MILTPGIAFTMGIRDFVQGDYLSGTIRMIDALLIAASIAIGTGLVLSSMPFEGGGRGMTELLFTGEQLGRLALQFLLAGAGTLSFAILFACPRRTLPYCGLGGRSGLAGIRDRGAVRDGSLCGLAAGGHPADAAGPHPCDDPQNTGDGVPAHRHLSAGAGAGIYYSAYYFIQGNNALALANGISTFKIAVALAVGIAWCWASPCRRNADKTTNETAHRAVSLVMRGTFAGRMQRKGGNTRAKCIYTQRMWCCMYKCFQKGFICSDFLHNT